MDKVEKFVADFLKKNVAPGSLSPGEYKEAVRIANGYTLRRASEEEGLGVESIRSRRKNLYRKAKVAGAQEFVQQLFTAAINKKGA